MAGISDEDIQKVRDASDLVAGIGERTPVKQKGRDFWCCCPLHQEKTPSFKIDPATQLWHCFGCGKKTSVSISACRRHVRKQQKKRGRERRLNKSLQRFIRPITACGNVYRIPRSMNSLSCC